MKKKIEKGRSGKRDRREERRCGGWERRWSRGRIELTGGAERETIGSCREMIESWRERDDGLREREREMERLD